MTLATRLQRLRFTATGIAIGLATALPAAAQHATYAVAWGAPIATGSPYGDKLYFDCGTPNSTYRLFLTVKPTEDITDLLAIDCRFLLIGDQPGTGYPNPQPRHTISTVACPGSAGSTSHADLNCTGGQDVELIVTFEPAEAIPDLVSGDGIFDLFTTPDVTSNCNFFV